MKAVNVLVVILFASVVFGDVYMHVPPGSNCRNRERNDNRNNGDRLFDSQNNGKGGYPWRGDATATTADPVTYLTDSTLRMEWTNQHACGTNPNVKCEVIIQYACDTDLPGLRDGYPSGTLTASDNDNAGYQRRQFAAEGQNADGTNTIPDNRYENDEALRRQFYYEKKLGGVEFGMHEGIDYYNTCKRTARNTRIYTADQKLNNPDARSTRQNPNGARRGLECPEERDYYPYWRPSPWKDIAVLVNNANWCEYFQEKSQNTAPVGFCNCNTACQNQAPNQRIPITAGACSQFGGRWEIVQKNIDKPDCLVGPTGRDNHLGNAFLTDEDNRPLAEKFQVETAHYNVKFTPDMAGKECVLRLRYNISTGEYPDTHMDPEFGGAVGFDSSKNCPRVNQNADNNDVDGDGTQVTDGNAQCTNLLTANSKPLFNRPYVNLFGVNPDTNTPYPSISIAMNTNQVGRTFQDRSYVFRVRNAPDGVDGDKVINLGVRGRRGNIVQAYPAVEYDFVPTILECGKGDWIHVQIHGSDYNEAKNANNGEGWRYSDRSNMIQLEKAADNIPMYIGKVDMFPDANMALRFALLDQDPKLCKEYRNGDNNEQNAIDNCGKLNRARNLFPTNPVDGLMSCSAIGKGTYEYVSTRNNNFSNRSQKARLIVDSSSLSTAAAVGIAFAAIAAVGLLIGGVCFYGKRNPNTRAGACYTSCSERCCSRCQKGAAAPRGGPETEYTRHKI